MKWVLGCTVSKGMDGCRRLGPLCGKKGVPTQGSLGGPVTSVLLTLTSELDCLIFTDFLALGLALELGER